jgi:hypothetical protein
VQGGALHGVALEDCRTDGRATVHCASLAARRFRGHRYRGRAGAVRVSHLPRRLLPERRPGNLARHAQLRWDYVAAKNGMGFHSPLECERILAASLDLAGQCRIECTRILAKHGVTKPIDYPDFSTKEKAQALIKPFVDGKPPKLLWFEQCTLFGIVRTMTCTPSGGEEANWMALGVLAINCLDSLNRFPCSGDGHEHQGPPV